MTTTADDFGTYFGKAVGVGLTAGALNKFWFGASYSNSAWCGAVAAASVVAADVITDKMAGTHSQVDKSLESRTLEVIMTGGTFYGLEKALGSVDNSSRPFNERLGIVVLSELVGDYVFNL